MHCPGDRACDKSDFVHNVTALGLLVYQTVAAVAQMVEHVIRNDGVGGSSPFSGTTN